ARLGKSVMGQARAAEPVGRNGVSGRSPNFQSDRLRTEIMSKTLDAAYRQLLETASFAARAHQGHVRKDLCTPSARHPLHDCLLVTDLFGFDERLILITALLHDTIEDTTTDFDDLEEKYGAEIASWVGLLTKDKRLPEAERERVYIDALKEAPWQVQVCKLADLFDNLMDLRQLPTDRQAKSLERYEHAFAALRDHAAPSAKQPIAILPQLLAEMK